MGNKISEILSNRTKEEIEKIKEKSSLTKLEKYGDPNYNNREKSKETCLEKYGVENPLQVAEIKNKVKHTQYEKYGGFFNLEQFFLTNLEKYGHKYPLQNKKEQLRFSKILRKKYNSIKKGAGYVYIVYFIDLKLIKIGYTSNMKNRSVLLRKDFGSFDIIKLEYFNEAFKEEARLHNLYDKYNVVLDEGVGRTEMFLPEILEFIS